MKTTGYLALVGLFLVLMLSTPMYATRDLGDIGGGYYHGVATPTTISGYVNGLTLNGLTPRRFADYLWDEHPQDMIAKGWATAKDLPDSSDPDVPFQQFKGTPYTVYQHIFNDTAAAADLTATYHWGVPISCAYSNQYCSGTGTGQYSVVPAGRWWRISEAVPIFMAMAAGGYTQQEIIWSGLYSGFDIHFVMESLIKANSNEQTYYSAISNGDVDPEIYGTHPYIMTFTKPVWSLISTGPIYPPGNSTGTPWNPHFGELVFGWNDVLTDCAPPHSQSSACWKGERPSYLIVPSEIVDQIGLAKLQFISSTTRRLIGGAPIVKDNSIIYNNGEGQGNPCRTMGASDNGCVTLDQYKTYYDDMQSLTGPVNAWEKEHNVRLLWGGVPLEGGIPYWVSQSQILSPFDATLTISIHDPNYMQTPGNISAVIDAGNEYIQLIQDPKTYAYVMYNWLQYYSFTRDFTKECALLSSDYPLNTYLSSHVCDPKVTLEAIQKFVVDQSVADSNQTTNAISNGEGLSGKLDDYSLSDVAATLGKHIAYLWNGCDGLCKGVYAKKSSPLQTDSTSELKYFISASYSYSQYLADFLNNKPLLLQGKFRSPLFFNLLEPYSRFIFQLGTSYWTQFQDALRTCTSNSTCTHTNTNSQSPSASSQDGAISDGTYGTSALSIFSQPSLGRSGAALALESVKSVPLRPENTTVTVTVTAPNSTVTVTANQTYPGSTPSNLQRNAITIPTNMLPQDSTGIWATIITLILLLFIAIYRPKRRPEPVLPVRGTFTSRTLSLNETRERLRKLLTDQNQPPQPS